MLSKLWNILEKSCIYNEQDPEKVDLFLKEFNSLRQLIKGMVSGRRYQRLSLVAGLINSGLIAPMISKDTMTSDSFEAWF